MKNFILLLTIAAFVSAPFLSNGQNMVLNPGLEQWDNSTTPTGWDLFDNISQESTNIHGGTYSAAHMSASSSKKFRQDIGSVTPGTQYTISYWYLDNDPSAKTRIWSYWMDASGTYLDDDADVLRPGTYSEDNPSWQQFSATLTAPANAAQFRFEVRVYNQDNNTGGYVYYDDFEFSGQTSSDPEPTNYPTDFAADSNGLSINLTWTDATGAQLPSGYLILGAKDGYSTTAPQDGTPVADDFDWSDGTVAANVAYGQQSFTFSNLEAFTSYTFTIYPYSNGGATIDYKTDGSAPTVTQTTPDITVLNSEDFEDGTLGDWTPHNVSGDQVWEPYTYSDNTFAKMSGYDSGNHANEDWLVSPELDFSNFVSGDFTFDNAYSYDGNALMLLVSTDYDGTSSPETFTWIDITSSAAWSGGSYSWVPSGNVNLDDYLGQKIYLAFKYTSTDDASSTWEVDNMFVYGVTAVGISENSADAISVYPNPATGYFTLNANQNGRASIMDVSGRVVMNSVIVSGSNNINIANLTAGIYFINTVMEDGSKASAKLMVK